MWPERQERYPTARLPSTTYPSRRPSRPRQAYSDATWANVDLTSHAGSTAGSTATQSTTGSTSTSLRTDTEITSNTSVLDHETGNVPSQSSPSSGRETVGPVVRPRGTDVPIPRITLSSQMTNTPNISVLLLAVGSILLTCFTIYYGWNASLSSDVQFLWDRPDYTIFTANLLSYLATLILTNLVTSTCDQLRWKKSCTENGMPFLSFLALSPGTSVLGLIHLLFSPWPRPVFSSGHRIWSLQRYPLLIL